MAAPYIAQPEIGTGRIRADWSSSAGTALVKPDGTTIGISAATLSVAASGDTTGATDTAAIQSAINTIGAAGGGTLLLTTPGTYYLSRAATYTVGPPVFTHYYCVWLGDYNNLVIKLGAGVTVKLADNQFNRVGGYVTDMFAGRNNNNLRFEGAGIGLSVLDGNARGQTAFPGVYTQSETGHIFQSVNTVNVENLQFKDLTLYNSASNPLNINFGTTNQNLTVSKLKCTRVEHVHCGEGVQVVNVRDWSNTDCSSQGTSVVARIAANGGSGAASGQPTVYVDTMGVRTGLLPGFEVGAPVRIFNKYQGDYQDYTIQSLDSNAKTLTFTGNLTKAVNAGCAITVFPASGASPMENEYTTLTSGVSGGVAVLPVAAVTGSSYTLKAGMPIAVLLANGQTHISHIASIVSLNVTLCTALPSAANSGAYVWTVYCVGDMWESSQGQNVTFNGFTHTGYSGGSVLDMFGSKNVVLNNFQIVAFGSQAVSNARTTGYVGGDDFVISNGVFDGGADSPFNATMECALQVSNVFVNGTNNPHWQGSHTADDSTHGIANKEHVFQNCKFQVKEYFNAVLLQYDKKVKFCGCSFDAVNDLANNSIISVTGQPSYLAPPGRFIDCTFTRMAGVFALADNGQTNVKPELFVVGCDFSEVTTDVFWSVSTQSNLENAVFANNKFPAIATDFTGFTNANGNTAIAGLSRLTISASINQSSYKTAGTVNVAELHALNNPHKDQQIVLRFTGSVTVKNNSAATFGNHPYSRKFKLAGGVDFAATADDCLTLQFDASTGFWHESGRSAN